jgi:7-cyano-7-deazaguanine synthase
MVVGSGIQAHEGAHQRAALVLFSAGQDSATCLAWALNRYDRVETIGFDYGQRHAVELAQRPVLLAVMAGLRPGWSERLGPDTVVDLKGFGALAHSALTGEGDIGALRRGLPASFVPGRNLAFLTYAGAHAWLRELPVLIGGMCETDFAGYPDCRSDTLNAMETALRKGLDYDLRLETPLMRLTKAETWALANAEGGEALVSVIREYSHTCYEGVRESLHAWGYGCGVCPACVLRRTGWEAFAGA